MQKYKPGGESARVRKDGAVDRRSWQGKLYNTNPKSKNNGNLEGKWK